MNTCAPSDTRGLSRPDPRH